MTEPHLLPVADTRRTRTAMRGVLRAQRTQVWLALAALLAAAGCGLAAAPLLGHVVDLAADRTTRGLAWPVVLLAAAAVGQGAASYVGLRLVAQIGERFLAATRERFVDRALDLPLERVERGGSGDLTSRITEDIAMVSDAVRSAVPEFVSAALVIVLTVAGLAALDWRFGLAALVAAVPIQAATTRWYLRRSAPIYGERRRSAAGEQQQLLDTLAGAPTVRAFGLADDHVERLGHRVDRTIDAIAAVTYLQTRFFGRLNIAELTGLAAVLATGFWLVHDGAVSIGTASAAALYFANLFSPINAVLMLLDTLQSATASLARLIGVADLPATPTPTTLPAPTVAGPAVPTPAVAGAPDAPAGSLVARGVRYSYQPGHEVLHGLDLTVPAGTSVALVGPSGGGKSTLARLLAGLHRPDAGTIHLDGRPVDATSPAPSITLVTQEVYVFAGTLAEDLRLAAPDASDDALWAALTDVGLAAWARTQPEGLATVIGADGHDLDATKAQQLALARLALADPTVAILDEATAEAGSAGARLLETAARQVTRGRTTVLVAHRLSQAATAEHIVVLDGGHIVEQGTHDALVATGGRYAQLWHAWSASRATPSTATPSTATSGDGAGQRERDIPVTVRVGEQAP
ncbi:ABC transporter ATP-binding protein/permease [Frankia sp. AgPm24]|uniref:ABC transporter ATP-binding protein n=1 Tax=Frankia sp. AgPm24 TaxID=631128 RepID=UPI00200F054B|nr:ABC transporter ATP-binding protein [Frankia sp. AgPm24]MCK9923693.1 ABC transporter ATP-binding protein/permease [Frankia sp. AgPm24]